MNKQVVVFSAHPDDHIVYGGTLIKLIKAGYSVHEILLTDGQRARLLNNAKAQGKEVGKIRLKELQKAHKLIGIANYTFLNLDNGNISPTEESFKEAIQIIRELKPQIILTLHTNDYHPDHIATANFSIDVVKTANISTLSELGPAYRVPILLMAEGLLTINPHIVIDISNEWKTRNKVEKIYGSQMTPRMTQWSECFAGKNGYLLRTKYAEAFEIPNGWPADISQMRGL